MANPQVELVATVKGTSSTVKVVATPEGHVYTARYLPDNARLVHDGIVWGFQDTSALTIVTTVPTTATLECLYNNEGATGKSYLPLGVMCHILTPGAGATEDFTIMGAVLNYKNTLPTNDFTTRFNAKGLIATPGSSNSIVDRALTVDTAPNWITLGTISRTSAVNDDGAGQLIPVSQYGFELPPNGGAFVLTVVGTAAGTCTLGMMWAEYQFS